MSKKFRNRETGLSGAREASWITTEDATDDATEESEVDEAEDYSEDESDEAPRQNKGAGEKPQTIIEPWTMSDPRYRYLAIAILLGGAALRMVLLQSPPFMHDEGIHAMFAYNFNTYKYDPV